MPSVRVYQKKQIRLDLLTVPQEQMFKIGNLAVAAVKSRVTAAQGPDDSAAKPLTRYYAIRKTKLGKGNRRNLTLTGDMLRAFMVRTVSDNTAKASFSTLKNRIKGWINQKIQPWVVFSPKNEKAVVTGAQQIVNERLLHLLLSK